MFTLKAQETVCKAMYADQSRNRDRKQQPSHFAHWLLWTGFQILRKFKKKNLYRWFSHFGAYQYTLEGLLNITPASVSGSAGLRWGLRICIPT